MAYLEVNHQLLREMADAIDSCRETQKQQMRQADTAVKGVLGTGWVGEDAAAFGVQWAEADGTGSTAGRLDQSLENFADAIRGCAAGYQTAQEDICNRAYLLPRW